MICKEQILAISAEITGRQRRKSGVAPGTKTQHATANTIPHVEAFSPLRYTNMYIFLSSADIGISMDKH